ncbi:hypothetical protein [Pyruvatibacter mobilis]|uniref:hypothetical protein n=1 Tax=Pyruvatibacter mobilis TaxID=1712261 RepID=UPI003BA8DFF2
MEAIKERLTESSTWAGLSAITIGISTIVDWDEGTQVAAIVQGVGEQAATGNWMQAVMVGLGGVFGIIAAANRG